MKKEDENLISHRSLPNFSVRSLGRRICLGSLPHSLSYPVNGEREKLQSDQGLWTVEFSKPITRREKTLLLESFIGIFLRKEFLGIEEYLLLEFLTSNLLGERVKVSFLENLQERHLASVSIVILKYGTLQFHLLRKEERFPVVEFLNTFDFLSSIRNQRIFSSRIVNYFPGNWMKISPVPESENDQRVFFSRYTGYCKGYGESHPKQISTPRSRELDGEDFEEKKIFDPQFYIFLTKLSLILQKYRVEETSLLF